jgi:hypothetical protein
MVARSERAAIKSEYLPVVRTSAPPRLVGAVRGRLMLGSICPCALCASGGVHMRGGNSSFMRVYFLYSS